jgi:hypothetical protein
MLAIDTEMKDINVSQGKSKKNANEQEKSFFN